MEIEKMEAAKQQDLFCIQCKLQFGKKIVFDQHLSLVHNKKVETASIFAVQNMMSTQNNFAYISRKYYIFTAL